MKNQLFTIVLTFATYLLSAGTLDPVPEGNHQESATAALLNQLQLETQLVLEQFPEGSLEEAVGAFVKTRQAPVHGMEFCTPLCPLVHKPHC